MERLTEYEIIAGHAHAIPTLIDMNSIVAKLTKYEDLEEKGLLPKFHLGDEFWTVRLREVLKSKIVMLQQKKMELGDIDFVKKLVQNTTIHLTTRKVITASISLIQKKKQRNWLKKNKSGGKSNERN